MTSPVADPPPAQRAADTSVGQLIRDVAEDVTTLVRQEIALAKAETKQELTKSGKAGAAFGGAGLAGWITLVFLSLAVMFGLGAVIPLGWAALIVAVVWAVVGAALAAYGRTRMRAVNPVPTRTVETVKEDVAWIKNRNA